MNFSAAELIALITAIVDSRISKANGGSAGPVVYGQFVQAETVDATLSVVSVQGDVAGTTIRGVRKNREVSTLVAGDVVMMLKTNNTPLTIIGVVTGDITKIEV